MTQVPIDIVISSKKAEEGERKAVRSLDNIREKANQTKNSNKELEKSFRGVGSGIAAIDGPLGGIASRFTSIRTLVQSTGFAIASFTVGLAGAGFAMRAGVRDAIQFSSAMAEVNTLVNDDFAFNKLTKSIRGVAKEFGQLPTAQAKAAYQIISAGASTASEAIDTLTASNKLAIGGVTDVATAADGLTTILNAYGERVGTATNVSDALFVAMRAGKTTIGELSSSIGKVAPLAAQTNTSLEELLSGVAALTKGGISTTEAVTGMRAVLAAVAKPTSEASELAEKLGLNFSAAGIESKGFAAFIQEVTEKTGGSTAQLSKLFGGVEALIPVLALSGAAGEDFKQILEDMGIRAGETEKAFNKMAETPQFKINQLKGLFVDLGIRIGDALLAVIIPAVDVLINNFGDLVTIAEALAIVIGVRLVGALVLATAKLVINTAAVVANQVQMARLAAAVGGTTTSYVLFTGAATTAARGLALLAGPLAIGAAVGAYFLLKNRVSSATEAFNSFLATITVIGGGLLKLANYASVPARAIVESFSKAFGQTQKLFDSFILDVRDFFRNPFDNNGLARTSNALGELFSFGAAESIQAAIKDVETFNAAIDKTIDAQLVKWGKQNREAAEETEDLGATSADTSKQIQELIDKLNNNNGNSATDALDKTKTKTKEAKEAVKEFSEETKKLSTIIERAGERIFDTFADTIDDFLKGDIGSWEDYAGKITDIFRSTFANISALALAKPIIVPIIGAAAGAVGLGTDATNKLGQSFGVSNLSDLSSLTNLGSSLFDPLLSSGGLVGNTIDKVGNFFGVGGLEAQGPTLSGAAGYQGGVSNLINPANILASFAGSKLADLFGLSGKYSGITGTLGGIGGSIAGASIGSSLGTIAGFAGGPAGALIGTLLGSFGGSALGGLFGGKPSDKGQWAISDLAGTVVQEGGLSGKKFSQENRDLAKSFSQLGGSVAKLFETISGQEASFNQIQVKVGNRDGSFVNFGQDGQFDVSTRKVVQSSGTAIFEAIVKGLREKFTELPENIGNLIDNLDFSNVETALQDLDLISQVAGWFKAAEEPMTQTAQALQNVEANFNTIKETLMRLGATVDVLNKLEEKRAEALNDVKNTILQSTVTDYLGEVSPGLLQLKTLRDNYQAQKAELDAGGISTFFLDKTYQIRQEKILQDIIKNTYSERISQLEAESETASRLVEEYSRLATSLGNAVRNLRLSEISPLSARDKYNEARANFLDISNRAALGDTEAMGELEGIGRTFLDLSRDYYASTEQFVQDFELVQTALEKAQGVAERQVTLQEQIAMTAKTQIEAIYNSSNSIVSSLDAQTVLLQKLADGAITQAQWNEQIQPILTAAGVTSTPTNAAAFDVEAVMAARPDIAAAGLDFNTWFKRWGSTIPEELEYLQKNFVKNDPAASAGLTQVARELGIPGFDAGGDVLSNSLFMVGERRPEIFRAGNQGGKVIPLENGQQLEQRLEALEKAAHFNTTVQQTGFKRLEATNLKQIEAINAVTQAIKRQ